MQLGRWGFGVLSSLALVFPTTSFAFELETAISDACHERITLSAISQSTWPSNALAPTASHEDVVLANNLPFAVPAQIDRWSMSMLVGVRDNDLGGFGLSDLPELAMVHGAEDQSAHCLRSSNQDFDEGDQQALAACRAFIHREIDLAVAQRDEPDLAATEDVMIALRFQRLPVRLSRYAFHVGRALHALQDSYAHSFRQTDSEEVVSVLNYVDAIIPNVFDVSRDGHAHMGAMDKCKGSPTADRRAAEATAASVALLNTVAHAGSRAERTTQIDALLDRSLRYLSGCDSKNEWCGNGTETVQVPTSEQAHGCSAAGSTGIMTALVMLAARARRRSFSAR